MSSYHGQYYQHRDYQDHPQVLLATTSSPYNQYDFPGDKTPTSLINHTGHSPGPLSTPPMSRTTSALPDQAPEPMVWDEAAASLSNSPTSISTPDNESFGEVDMLDAMDGAPSFYSTQLEPMVTSHMSQGAVPALDSTTYFTDQVLQDELTLTLASQQPQYQTLFSMPNQAPQAMLAAEPYNQVYGQDYTNQSPRQDPWTSQRPSHNPPNPRSGIVVFDPASDVVFPNHVHPDVFNWMENTDHYLVSPSEPVAPPQDNFFPYQNHFMAPNSENNSPVEMRITGSSPSPDHQNFVNYHPTSAFFTENYITEPGHQSGSSDSSGTFLHSLSMAPQRSLSPYQAAISPQTSLPSPGASEDVLSTYQHSDPGMGLVTDAYLYEQLDVKPVLPKSPIEAERLSHSTSSGTSVDTSPEPEPKPRGRSTTKASTVRPGGRALGTHLDPNVAKAAHDMRKTVACWHCVLQRDKCGPGDICGRCLKRAQRANADCGLGCSRIRLIELAQYFLPSLVTQMHEDAHLTHFVSRHIRQWGNNEITVMMTCGQKAMPRIPVKVYEFLPNGDELLVQYQYKTNFRTGERYAVKNQSPALGMVHINQNEEKKYDKYLSDIVDNYLDAFGSLCWKEDDNDFQEKLFKLMTQVKPKSDDEAKLLREVFRLIVCTYIMGHTLSIAQESKHAALSKMHSYLGRAYEGRYTSPRMTNRQLKYFFNRLQRTIVSTVLNKLQQIFKSSKGCDKWVAAFIAVVGMCMAYEDQQKTIHCVMETKASTEGWDRRDAQARADIACREIDDRMTFVAQIFRWKYNRKINPLRESDYQWDREDGFGDASSAEFVRQVAQLVKENIDYLQLRQKVSISASNQTKYTSRLVGQFLLSFWLPQ